MILIIFFIIILVGILSELGEIGEFLGVFEGVESFSVIEVGILGIEVL